MRTHILPLLVPAKTTSLLQPLDVYVFRSFKELLRRKFHDLYAVHTDEVDVNWFLQVLYEVIEAVIVQRAWPTIFEQVGLGEGQMLVTRYILDHLGVPLLAPLAIGHPSAADLAAVLPRGRIIAPALFLPPPMAALALLPAPPVAAYAGFVPR